MSSCSDIAKCSHIQPTHTSRNSVCATRFLSPVYLQHWSIRTPTQPLFPAVYRPHNTLSHTHTLMHTLLFQLVALTLMGTLSCVLSSRITQQSRVCSGMAASAHLRTQVGKRVKQYPNLHQTSLEAGRASSGMGNEGAAVTMINNHQQLMMSRHFH